MQRRSILKFSTYFIFFTFLVWRIILKYIDIHCTNIKRQQNKPRTKKKIPNILISC